MQNNIQLCFLYHRSAWINPIRLLTYVMLGMLFGQIALTQETQSASRIISSHSSGKLPTDGVTTGGKLPPRLPYSSMALTAKFVGPAIADPDWYNWGISPIVGEDGKVHMIESRWPAKDGMEGWTEPNAQIVHYVADRPEGPFRYVGTILTSSMFPHESRLEAPTNSRIKKVDDKYVLLYITQMRGADREGQRIGMMIADNINGPWRFAGNNNGTVLAPSADPQHWTYNSPTGVNNPDILKIGKKYYIYFKGVVAWPTRTRYGYAVSDHLEGPYTIADHPITDNVSVIEDGYVFAWGGKYYMLTTDNNGNNTGKYGAIILWQSTTGLKFKLANAKIAMGDILDYWGSDEDRRKLSAIQGHFVRSASGKMERPAILFIHGKPSYFYGPADINVDGGSVSETYVFRFDWADGK